MGTVLTRRNKNDLKHLLKFLHKNQDEYNLAFIQTSKKQQVNLILKKKQQVSKSLGSSSINLVRIITSSHLFPPHLTPAEIKDPYQ